MFRKLFILLIDLWMIQSIPSTAMERIVYMERTVGSQQMIESEQIHALATVLGSEAAARKAIIYSYKNINGFSAILTESQVEALAKQPGVLKILPAPMYELPEELSSP